MLGVSRFEDLDIYKLAAELRSEVLKLCARERVARDFKFVDQIRDAVRGGPRNIAEGFARVAPREFHKFLSYAKASIDETKNHVYDGHESGYFTDAERDRLLTLARRTAAGITGLMVYLDSPEAKRAYESCATAPGRARNDQRTRTHKNSNTEQTQAP